VSYFALDGETKYISYEGVNVSPQKEINIPPKGVRLLKPTQTEAEIRKQQKLNQEH
jgi:hypothetical protein